jgi:hypothetical protein
MENEFMKPKLILCLALVLSGGFIACCIGFWVINPSISGLPAIQENWSSDYYARLLRERYPIHLIDPDPTKYIYGRHWPDAESVARLGVVIVGLVLIFAIVRFIRRKKHTA